MSTLYLDASCIATMVLGPIKQIKTHLLKTYIYPNKKVQKKQNQQHTYVIIRYKLLHTI
jgi:hypothetical protein